MPVHSTKKTNYKCVCVCVPLRLPLSNTLVSSDATPSRGGAGASITGDNGAAASAGGGIIASAASIAASAASSATCSFASSSGSTPGWPTCMRRS
jgi:hypothetical protein